jgi:hypothetical protein
MATNLLSKMNQLNQLGGRLPEVPNSNGRASNLGVLSKESILLAVQVVNNKLWGPVIIEIQHQHPP